MEYMLAMKMTRGKKMKRKMEYIHKSISTWLSLSEDECLQCFHLPRIVVTEVCNIMSKDLASKTSFPLGVRVVSALHFFATGSMQSPPVFAEGIAPTTMNTFIAAVSQELVRQAPNFITFPSSPGSQAQVKKQFQDKFGVQDIVGVIDCTHVVLRAPMGNSNVYFNNEGSYSVNIQLICNASCKITHVLSHFPATTPDSSIFERSEIPSIFEKKPAPKGKLLGDSAYPLKTWLVTPFSRPKTKQELSFNIKHLDTFEAMDQTVGMLKKRFRCLDKQCSPLQYSPHKVGMFFVACCVLHNIALRHGCQMEIDEDTIRGIRRLDNAMHVPLPEAENNSAAISERNQLAQELYGK